MTERERQRYLIDNYADMSNKEICEKLQISIYELAKYREMLKLKKSLDFMRKSRKKGTMKMLEANKRNGYPPKGVPRQETPEFKAMRIRKLSETRRNLMESERLRIACGLPQKTKLHFGHQSRSRIMARSYLRKRGYICERGSYIVYYDENTHRSIAIEKRKKGDKHYIYFEFKPISEKE